MRVWVGGRRLWGVSECLVGSPTHFAGFRDPELTDTFVSDKDGNA